MEFLDFTSVTLEEFQQLVPPFETAYQARMAAWRMDGKPRTARRFTVDRDCPLPTPEDRLFFLLTYLIRLWKEGVRDLVMEICCALHNFRVRLTPWQPMV